MSSDDASLSDDDLNKAFDEVMEEGKGSDDAPEPDDIDTQVGSEGGQNDPESDPEPKPATPPSLVDAVLVAISEADTKDMRKFDASINSTLDNIAESDEETQMLVIALGNRHDLPMQPAARVLSGVVYRRSQLNRDGKRVDWPDLNRQTRSYLQGKLLWGDIVPKEYTESKSTADPDMVAAGEMAAILKCTVVDVLALAGLREGDDKTLVSRTKVVTALEELPAAKNDTPDDKPKVFDHEAEGNQLGDDSDDDRPVTGFEYITIDSDDPLADLDGDWFVKGCRSLVNLLES